MALSDYITDTFGQVKTQLGWTDSDQLVTITAKALELYGVATEVLATDLTKLHALADIAVWRQAVADTSLDYNFAADNASFQRSQANAQARQNLHEAEMAAVIYSPAYQMIVHKDASNEDWEV